MRGGIVPIAGAWLLALAPGCGGPATDDNDLGSGPSGDTEDGSSSSGGGPQATTDDSIEPTGSSTSGGSTDTGIEPGTTSGIGETTSDGTIGTTTGSDGPPACAFFHDDFSSGDASWSENGFVWQNQGFAVSDAFGHGDDHALRFAFGPDAPGEDSTSELRFELGRELTEIWIELYVYYPNGTEDLGSARYEHRNDESSDNNKFLRLWSGDYNSRPKVGASTLPVDEGAGNSHLINEYNPVGSSMGNFSSGGSAWVTDDEPDTCQRGSWCQVRMHYRIADVGQSNGEARWWVDGTLVYENTELPNASDSETENFLDRGYLLGWANSGFSDQTQIHIDDVTFCDTDPDS